MLRKAGVYTSPPPQLQIAEASVDCHARNIQGWSWLLWGLRCPLHIGLMFPCSEWVWKMADGSSYSFNQKRKRRNPLSSSTTKSSLLIWPHAHCCGQSTGWGVVLGREEEFPYEKRVQGRQNPRQICQQGLPSVIRGSLFGLLQGWIWRREP